MDATPGMPGKKAPVRLLIVVAADCSPEEVQIVAAVSDLEAFDVTAVGVTCSHVPESRSILEVLYRAADRRVFGRSMSDHSKRAIAIEVGEPAEIARRVGAAVVVDLTGTLTGTRASFGVLVVALAFEGLPGRSLARAVRRRLGTHRGTLHVRAVAQSGQVPQLLFSAACYIDHRSLVRSLDLTIRKVPMILLAALRRQLDRRGSPEEAGVPNGPVSPARRAAELVWRLCLSIGHRLMWRDQWRIVVYRDQPRSSPGPRWVTLAPDRNAFWADPFVVPHDGGAAVFFEELPFDSGRGRISLIEIDANGRAGLPVAVLDKPWHLSYPFIFEWAGRRYMIPESLANETVDLYECEQFPRRWRHVRTLIKGQRLADASLIHWNGRLWMFAAHGAPGASAYDELHIYWADDLFGPWHPHALNPVKIDAGSARPAGTMFIEHGRIVRPTQDCRNRYGDGVCFQEVTLLDGESFAERPLSRLTPMGAKPNEPFHTYNAAGRYMVIDASGSTPRWPVRSAAYVAASEAG